MRPILLPAMAADAMAQVPGGGELALGGYSMGGRAALLAAIASPGRITHLALISTTAGIEETRSAPVAPPSIPPSPTASRDSRSRR